LEAGFKRRRNILGIIRFWDFLKKFELGYGFREQLKEIELALF